MSFATTFFVVCIVNLNHLHYEDLWSYIPPPPNKIGIGVITVNNAFMKKRYTPQKIITKKQKSQRGPWATSLKGTTLLVHVSS